MDATQAKVIVNTLVDRNLNAFSAPSKIDVVSIINALNGVEATTFATLTQASRVALAAKNDHKNFYKITVQNVTLCNSSAGMYVNKVNRENLEGVKDFEALPSNYVMIGDSYSVCALKSDTSKHYLRAIVNKCIESVYIDMDRGVLISKEEVAKYCTLSAAEKILNPSSETHVKHANVTHSVIVRTFALKNIYSINVNKQALVA